MIKTLKKLWIETSLLVSFSFLFLSQAVFAKKARPIAVVDNIIGNAFLTENGKTTILRKGSYIRKFSKIVTEMGSQITINDYFDHTSGTDEANYNYMVPYSGGSRSIQMGLISAKGILIVSLVAFALSAVVGVPLIQKSGMNILWLGLIGFVSGFFYTAPPFRFASRKGLGELLIGLNFGPLMVAGSALVQTGKILPEALLAGIPIGLLVAAIVYVNEFPDHDGDKATGKDTLIVVFGPEKARAGYVLLVAGAFVSIMVMAINGTFPMLSLIALPAAYFGFKAIQTLYKYYNDRLLMPANAGTINMHLVTGLLFCIGIWVG